MKPWVIFFCTLIKQGKLFHPLYWGNKERPHKLSTWKRILLKTPILCQVVSLIGLYRLNKEWPQYVYHCPEKKLAYIRIPKSASTSILVTLLKSKHQKIDMESMSIKEIHIKAQSNMKPAVQEGYEGFAVVRNPYDRLVSCYRDIVRNKNQQSYFHSLYFGLFTHDMTFEKFVETVKRIPDSIKDVHFKQQSASIPLNVNIKIFKIEEFESKVKPYLESHGLDVGSFKYNRSNAIDITDKSLAVREIYAKDYEIFNYNQS